MKRWMAMCLAIIMVLTMLPGTVLCSSRVGFRKVRGYSDDQRNPKRRGKIISGFDKGQTDRFYNGPGQI